jgi:hypothetical protein
MTIEIPIWLIVIAGIPATLAALSAIIAVVYICCLGASLLMAPLKPRRNK